MLALAEKVCPIPEIESNIFTHKCYVTNINIRVVSHWLHTLRQMSAANSSNKWVFILSFFYKYLKITSTVYMHFLHIFHFSVILIGNFRSLLKPSMPPTYVLLLKCIHLIANQTCNTTVTGSFCIRYSRIWHDPAIFPVIGPSVLSTANQNAWVMTQ